MWGARLASEHDFARRAAIRIALIVGFCSVAIGADAEVQRFKFRGTCFTSAYDCGDVGLADGDPVVGFFALDTAALSASASTDVDPGAPDLDFAFTFGNLSFAKSDLAPNPIRTLYDSGTGQITFQNPFRACKNAISPCSVVQNGSQVLSAWNPSVQASRYLPPSGLAIGAFANGSWALVQPAPEDANTTFSNASGTATVSFDYQITGTYRVSESTLGTSDTDSYLFSGTVTGTVAAVDGSGDFDGDTGQLVVHDGVRINAELISPAATDTLNFSLANGLVSVSLEISINFENVVTELFGNSMHQLDAIKPGAVAILSGDLVDARYTETNTVSVTATVNGVPEPPDVVSHTIEGLTPRVPLIGEVIFDDELNATRLLFDIAVVSTTVTTATEFDDGVTVEAADKLIVSNFRAEMDMAVTSPPVEPSVIPMPAWSYGFAALLLTLVAAFRPR